jgi:hypothetical protein
MSGVTISDYIPTTQKAAALGVATLDSSTKVPISQIPDSVIGALSYQGTWDASTNTPTLTSSVGTKGYYYVVSVAGSTNLDGITDWKIGDWAVYSGTAWQKIDNTDSVTSVNGFTGAVVLTNTDISGFGTMSTQNANSVAITGGSINGTTIGATTASTGAFTTATASTSLTTPTVQATNSAGLSLKNASGTTQMSMGAGGGDNLAINVSTNLNGTNAQIDISPTGTGHVHIKPSGTNSVEIAPTSVGTIDNMTIGATTAAAGSGSVEINPTSVGTIDNMTIGATTARNGSFVNLSVTGTTSFDGNEGTAGQVLTSAGTGATPTWATPSAATATNLAGGIASQIPYQSAANTTAFIANGSSGQILQSNGAAAPTWSNRTQYLGVLLNTGSTTQVPTSNGYIGILLSNGSTTTQVPIS